MSKSMDELYEQMKKVADDARKAGITDSDIKKAAGISAKKKAEVPVGTTQYSVSVMEEVFEEDGWTTNETFIVDRSENLEDIKRVLRGNVEEIIKTARKETEEANKEKEARKAAKEAKKKNQPEEVEE